MSEIDQPINNFKQNLEKVDELTSIGTDVSRLSVSFLRSLLEQNKSLPAFIPYKEKLQRTIDTIDQIKNHETLKDKFRVVYAQSLVLVVANFESYLNETAINIFDNYPYLVKWPEKKMALDLSLLKYSVPSTGELILRSLKDKFNFQDLQSTLLFLREYLEVNPGLSNDMRDAVILYQAQRHVIIHNIGKIDDRFLAQVRETEYSSKYSKDDFIALSENDYSKARDCFIEFASRIHTGIFEKLNEMMPF